MHIRTWAEYLEPSEAADRKVIDLLKRYDVTLGMAFPVGSMNDEYAGMLKAYEQAGARVMLWPLLSDASGYWACERNAREYADHVARIYDWADAGGFGIPWLAVDLELPVYQLDSIRKSPLPKAVQSIMDAYSENRDRGRFFDASAEYNRLVEVMHARGVKVLAAAGHNVADDIATGSIGFQDAQETPVSTVNYDVVSFMIYTSMFAGYSHGLLTRRDASWYLYKVMQDMKNVLWHRAGVSIGVTHTGKLEDEPYYESPQDLLPDMQAAKAALIEDVSIYNLEGILKSSRPEEWFETLISCEARVPERSLKIDAVMPLFRLAAKLI